MPAEVKRLVAADRREPILAAGERPGDACRPRSSAWSRPSAAS
jgi:hypothetical protein